MRKRRLLILAVAVAVVLLLSVPGLALAEQERITRFDSAITVNQDGSMRVEETIAAMVTGDQIQHGIYRDFPTIRSNAETGGLLVVNFHVLSVQLDGQNEPYTLESTSNGERVKLGSADVLIDPGEHTWVLRYSADHEIGFFADHDELYWNVTGLGWAFPIDRASATVTLPAGAAVKITGLASFRGAAGSTANDVTTTQSADGTPTFVTTSVLNPGEGLTITVGWPKGFVRAENGAAGLDSDGTTNEYNDATRADNHLIYLMSSMILAVLLLSGAIAIGLWRKRGSLQKRNRMLDPMHRVGETRVKEGTMSDKYFSEEEVIGKCYKCGADVSERGSVEMSEGGKAARPMCLDCYRSFLKHHVIMGIVWAVIGAVAGVAGGVGIMLLSAYVGWGLYYGATASFWNARFWRKASTAGAAPRGSWGEIGLNFLKVGVYLAGSLCYGVFGGGISRCLHDARELKAFSSLTTPQSYAEDEARPETTPVPEESVSSYDPKPAPAATVLGTTAQDRIVCPSCGYANSQASRFCTRCGVALAVADDPSAAKNQEDVVPIPYRKGNKWGYCDKNKRMILPAVYAFAQCFHGDFARVEERGKWGFIDTKGNMVVPAIYDTVHDSFCEGLAGVASNGRWGYVDTTGNMVVPMAYEVAGSFDNGLAGVGLAVKQGSSERRGGGAQTIGRLLGFTGKQGFIDRQGNMPIPAIYDETASSFSEGLAWVNLESNLGFINTEANMIIPAIYEGASSFSEGLAEVKVNDKWGFIDAEGKMIIPAIYEGASPFSEGLAEVKVNDKWGFIDAEGKVIIPAIYEGASSFSEGLAEVKVNAKWGFIDAEGKMIIPAIYEGASSFSEGLAAVTRNGKEGFVDTTGKVVIVTVYDFVGPFEDGLAYIELNEKSGFIDAGGTQYWEG